MLSVVLISGCTMGGDEGDDDSDDMDTDIHIRVVFYP
jgi:hypothetical protein